MWPKILLNVTAEPAQNGSTLFLTRHQKFFRDNRPKSQVMQLKRVLRREFWLPAAPGTEVCPSSTDRTKRPGHNWNLNTETLSEEGPLSGKVWCWCPLTCMVKLHGPPTELAPPVLLHTCSLWTFEEPAQSLDWGFWAFPILLGGAIHNKIIHLSPLLFLVFCI